MIKHIKNIAAVIILLFISGAAFAQDKTDAATTTDAPPQAMPPVEMATGLYQSGKIYVVVGVIAIIFAGIIAYLVMLDKKIGKLEKEINNK